MPINPPIRFAIVPVLSLGFILASCQQKPSVSEAQEACQRPNATITSVQFGEAFRSTEPEKVSGVPPNVTIYPVTVTYTLPSIAGADSQQSVARNLYRNFADEFVCD